MTRIESAEVEKTYDERVKKHTLQRNVIKISKEKSDLKQIIMVA